MSTIISDLSGAAVWMTQLAILVIAVMAMLSSRSARKEQDARTIMFAEMSAKIDNTQKSVESIHTQINSRMDQLIASVTLASRQEGMAAGLASSKETRESASADAQQITDAINEQGKGPKAQGG